MPTPMATPASTRAGSLADRASGERGSLLVEVMVTAVILLIVAVGVLKSFDTADARSSDQRLRAIAGNVAQSEHERLRALPLTELSNSHSTTARTVQGMRFDVTSDAEWVTDSSGEASCATGGASADYLRITTTVSSPRQDISQPVVLSSIVSPPARAFNADQGSLAVQVQDSAGDPVAGLTLTLDGPKNVSGTTNEKGCVLWGYLPQSSAYTLSFGSVGWVDPSGASNVAKTVSVVGEQTRVEIVSYDRGGSLRTDFFTRRARDGAAGALFATSPTIASIENPGPPSTLVSYDLTGNRLETPLLFPFSSDWAVFADDCAAAKPPEASGLVLGKVTPETITDTDQAVIPSLDYHVVDGTGTTPPAVSGATVVVVTSCGTKYTRTTGADGRLTDPGFPWGTGFSVCVSSGTGTTARKRTYTAVANTTLPGQDIAVNLNGLPATSTPCV
jgi:hypothetical protein